MILGCLETLKKKKIQRNIIFAEIVGSFKCTTELDKSIAWIQRHGSNS